MCLDGIDVIFKLATFDELNDFSNLKVYLGLADNTGFFRYCYFGCGSNHTYCDLIGSFL